jgi:WD40-like Beta Propeller Repeat
VRALTVSVTSAVAVLALAVPLLGSPAAAGRGLTAHAGDTQSTILYVDVPASGTDSLYEMNGDGSYQRIITSATGGSDFSLSRDGTKILYDNSAGIFMMNSDGTDPHEIVPVTSPVSETPQLAPDDTQVVYAASTGPSTSGIYVADLNEPFPPRLLTSGTSSDREPTWSPDGTQVAFARLETNGSGNSDIYAINTDGTNVRLVAPNGSDPSWSPLGQTLAYQSSDGTAPSVLLTVAQGGGTPTPVTPSSLGAVAPVWSPDGSELAFADNATSPTQVGLVDLATGAVSTLTAGPDAHGSPSWSGTIGPAQVACNAAYTLAGAGGAVFPFGTARYYGSMDSARLNAPVVSLATTPDGDGYDLVATDGGIFSFGDARFYGSTGGLRLNQPVVGMALTADGGGYWLVARDGGVFAFGDARFHGSMGGQHLNAPVVGMAADPATGGYWLVAADGGIFSFDAPFLGSMGNVRLNQPVVGLAAVGGGGYRLVARDGGLFSFGDAGFFGSTGGQTLDAPMVGLAGIPDGGGYWEVAADGGVFAFGDAQFCGSTGGFALAQPVVALAAG